MSLSDVEASQLATLQKKFGVLTVDKAFENAMGMDEKENYWKCRGKDGHYVHDSNVAKIVKEKDDLLHYAALLEKQAN